MEKSLFIVMLVSIVVLYMASPILSQEIDRYSQEVPEDVNIAPTPDFDIYIEAPGVAPYEAYSPAKSYDMEIAHHYSHKRLEYLQNCLKKPSPKCSDDIFNNMVDQATMELTDECCRDLLKIGKDCHLGLTQLIFSTYDYKNIASKAIPRSKQTWNDCVRRVGSQIGGPVSSED